MAYRDFLSGALRGDGWESGGSVGPAAGYVLGGGQASALHFPHPTSGFRPRIGVRGMPSIAGMTIGGPE